MVSKAPYGAGLFRGIEMDFGFVEKSTCNLAWGCQYLIIKCTPSSFGNSEVLIL